MLSNKEKTHIIRRGDTLWDIARANNTTVDNLADINNISNPNLIQVGQVIKLAADQIANSGGGSTSTNTTNATNNTTNKTPNKTTGNSFAYKDFTYDDYQESDIVKQAQAALNAQLAQKPGAYQSQWQTQLNDIMDKIMNREKFSYNFNEDALYQQYKDKFTKQGKLAMGDAIGQASAMTGGYGNSYAQSVGQQAYQAELDNLNDIVPELYQMAYDKYNQEGQDLLNQYALVGDQEDRDYGRYRDSVADWLTERDYLTGRYDSERDFDYSKYNNERDFAYGKYADDKSYAYQGYRDKIEDAQRQAEFDEAVRQYNASLAEEKRQFDETMKLKDTSVVNEQGNPGGVDDTDNTDKDKVGYNNGSLSASQIKTLQKVLGVSQDGKYGPASKQATGGLSADDAYKKYVLGQKLPNEPSKPSTNLQDFDRGQYSKNVEEKGGSYYSDALADLKEMKGAGKDNKAAQTYLAELVANSLITGSEYSTLYNKYRDNKL